MSAALAAIEFLAQNNTPPVPPVCVLFGDEPLLIRESLSRIQHAVLGDEEGEISCTMLDGKLAELRQVLDELATISMFGAGKRMVVVDEADKFVTKHREALEDYCQKPRSASVLVLIVDSWPANTRLYKRVAETGWNINCKLPQNRFGDIDEDVVLKWLATRAEQHHAKLGRGAGEFLLETIGPQLGQLDQELEKLSLLAGNVSAGGAKQSVTNTIARELVEQSVDGWRAKTAWTMIESALDGNAAMALVELDRLLLAGEEPIALLAMMSGSLRRLAAAGRIIAQAHAERRRISMDAALREAGVTPKKFVLEKHERQLKQIGWARARHIYTWLLEADLALKGASSSGDRPRLVLEQLIVRLAGQSTSVTGGR